jgi:hypothetical protein
MSGRGMQEVTLDGLEPNTMYHYRVLEASTTVGASIDSGLLTFQTAHGEDHPFVVRGSSGTPRLARTSTTAMANLIWEQRPHFVINCGDLTDGGKERRKFQWTHEYFQGMGQLHSRIPCSRSPGTVRAISTGTTTTTRCPSRRGTTRSGTGTRSSSCSTATGAGRSSRPGGEQYEWLKERLAASTAVWKFAAHHHPTVHERRERLREHLEGRAEPAGRRERACPSWSCTRSSAVDAVFFGHLHSYERSWPLLEGKVSADEGVVYIQTGGAGGNLEDFRPAKTWFNHNAFRGHHFCVISIHGGVLEFRMFNQDGSLRDVTRLTKETGDDAFAGVEP